jgi:hypothetical protein
MVPAPVIPTLERLKIAPRPDIRARNDAQVKVYPPRLLTLPDAVPAPVTRFQNVRQQTVEPPLSLRNGLNLVRKSEREEPDMLNSKLLGEHNNLRSQDVRHSFVASAQDLPGSG